MNYEVDLDLFKGPLDLLLYLIRKSELNIRDIEISKITSQYNKYIELMKNLDLEIAGDFIVMSAILMRIKARELLPQSEREKLENDDDFIDRENLIEQIEEHERFKNAAYSLRNLEDENLGSFYRKNVDRPPASEEDFLDNKDVEIYDLIVAFKKVTDEAEKNPVYFLEADNVTIDDRIEHVISTVSSEKSVTFTDLFQDDSRKIVIVVTFMAILEMIKLGMITFSQDNYLDDIIITEIENKEDIEENSVSFTD